jgi:hypothetical protein
MVQINDKTSKIFVTHINIRQSIFFLVIKLIVLDIMTAVFSIIYFISASNQLVIKILEDLMLSYNFLFFLILALFQIGLTIYIVLLWINEYYEIYPNQFIHVGGLFFKKQEKHQFSQMRSVKIEQGFFGKIFGFGTIMLYNWYLKTNTSLYLIHNPEKYFRIIESLIPKSEKDRQIFLDETKIPES